MQITLMSRDITDHAACASWDPTTFDDADDFTHPQLDQDGLRQLNQERRLRARVICAPCPVRQACLAWAVDNGASEGVYGGLAEASRRRLRRGVRNAGVWRGTGAPAKTVHKQAPAMVRAFLHGGSATQVGVDYDVPRRRVLQEVGRGIV